MRCSLCHQELLRLRVKTDEIREVWAHPSNPFKKCDYSQDGLQVTVEILDVFLMEKFQELVNSFPQQVEPGEVPPPILGKEIQVTNLQKIQTRIASGEIDYLEFLEIKKLLDLNE